MPDKKKEDTKLPNQSIPAAEIPDLKKKDKDRKKSGASWGSAKPAGTPFTGATAEEGALGMQAAVGGARAAVAAAGSAGASAGVGAEAGFFATLMARVGSILAELTATVLGKAAVMAVAALMIGAVVAIGYKMMAGSHASKAAPDLGDISSTLKVGRATSDARLDYAGRAANGQLDWDNRPIAPEDDKPAAKDDVAKNSEVKAPDAAAPGTQAQNGEAPVPQSKLAGSLGNALGQNPFGSGSGSGGVGAGAGAAAMAGSGVLHIGGDKGQLGKYGSQNTSGSKGGTLASKNIRGATGMNLKHLASSPSTSLALLRGMATKYNSAMRAGGSKATEANSAAGEAQFESSELSGATPPASPTDSAGSGGGGSSGGGVNTGGGSTVDPGTYQPNIDDPAANCDYENGAYWNGSACVTTTVPNTNATPWQGLVSSCSGMVIAACIMLFISGIMSIPAFGLLKSTCTFLAGLALWLIAFALALCAFFLGLMCIIMGNQINSMGGSPQGNVFMIAGGLLMVGGVVGMWAAWNGTGGTILGVQGGIVAAIASVIALVASQLG